MKEVSKRIRNLRIIPAKLTQYFHIFSYSILNQNYKMKWVFIAKNENFYFQLKLTLSWNLFKTISLIAIPAKYLDKRIRDNFDFWIRDNTWLTKFIYWSYIERNIRKLKTFSFRSVPIFAELRFIVIIYIVIIIQLYIPGIRKPDIGNR